MVSQQLNITPTARSFLEKFFAAEDVGKLCKEMGNMETVDDVRQIPARFGAHEKKVMLLYNCWEGMEMLKNRMKHEITGEDITYLAELEDEDRIKELTGAMKAQRATDKEMQREDLGQINTSKDWFTFAIKLKGLLDRYKLLPLMRKDVEESFKSAIETWNRDTADRLKTTILRALQDSPAYLIAISGRQVSALTLKMVMDNLLREYDHDQARNIEKNRLKDIIRKIQQNEFGGSLMQRINKYEEATHELRLGFESEYSNEEVLQIIGGMVKDTEAEQSIFPEVHRPNTDAKTTMQTLKGMANSMKISSKTPTRKLQKRESGGRQKRHPCFMCNSMEHHIRECKAGTKEERKIAMTEGLEMLSEISKKRKRDSDESKCHNCGGVGHNASDCPSPKKRSNE